MLGSANIKNTTIILNKKTLLHIAYLNTVEKEALKMFNTKENEISCSAYHKQAFSQAK